MIDRARDALLALCCAALVCAAIAEVQAGTESFRRSCEGIQRSASKGRVVISAICETGRGGDRVDARELTELVIPPGGCDDIANRKGTLRCVGAGAERPGGSWRDSCRNGSYWQGSIFRATCTGFQSNGITSIDVATCRRPQLKNVHGKLRCE
jgi:hypothetical protein